MTASLWTANLAGLRFSRRVDLTPRVTVGRADRKAFRGAQVPRAISMRSRLIIQIARSLYGILNRAPLGRVPFPNCVPLNPPLSPRSAPTRNFNKTTRSPVQILQIFESRLAVEFPRGTRVSLEFFRRVSISIYTRGVYSRLQTRSHRNRTHSTPSRAPPGNPGGFCSAIVDFLQAITPRRMLP